MVSKRVERCINGVKIFDAVDALRYNSSTDRNIFKRKTTIKQISKLNLEKT